MNNYIRKPVGLETFVSRIEEICSNPNAYHRCNVKPSHFLLNLDAGNGHSTVAAYVSDAFRTYGIRHFGGRELFLEYTLNGSKDQLIQVLDNIKDSADYTNEYEGVIAIDISGLAAHLNEDQVSIFLKELPAIGEHATLILYVPSSISRNMTLLIDKVCATLEDELEVVKVEAYSEENLVAIIRELVKESGVDMEDGVDIDSCIQAAIRQTGASTIKDAKRLTQVMVKNANFDHFIPELNCKLINTTFGISITKEVK